MNDLCMIIKEVVKPNFLNIRTAIQTYNREPWDGSPAPLFVIIYQKHRDVHSQITQKETDAGRKGARI